MSLSRTTIAAAATIAALAALAAVALASGGEDRATTAAPAPAAETDPPAEVRTQVIRRTIHERPTAPTSTDDDGTLDQGPGDRPATPVGASPASGHGGGSYDDDHGDDDEHGDDDSGHGRGRGGEDD